MPEYDDTIETMTEAAADYLFVERQPLPALPYFLASKFPTCAPLELTLCLATLADLVETELATTTRTDFAISLWRIASLIAVDVLVMETMGVPSLTAADLRTYWTDHDQYFLPEDAPSGPA